MYRTFITYVYGEFNDSKVKELDPNPYLAFSKEMQSKSYLVNEQKMARVSTYIEDNNLDVMFVQEAGFEGWESIVTEFYGVKRKNDSMIVYKKDVFRPDDNKEFEVKFGQQLNFNNDSTYFLTKSYLLISAHLTSKSNNVDQAKEMFKTL